MINQRVFRYAGLQLPVSATFDVLERVAVKYAFQHPGVDAQTFYEKLEQQRELSLFAQNVRPIQMTGENA